MGDGVPVIESEGRQYPLRIEWLGRRGEQRIEDAMADAIRQAWAREEGDILAFLPGVGEIARVRERLEASLRNAVILPLHGQVAPAEQNAAIARDPEGRRRIVLATAIAETSLTLDGVRVVVDSGLSRRAEFDRAAGTGHLVTVQSSRATADQRAGRAARQGPGVAYRLWSEAGHAGRAAYDPPEMETADLAPLVLSLARWGSGDPAAMDWLDPPPEPSLASARTRLRAMQALDDDGRITPFGQAVAQLPMEPAHGAMLLYAARGEEAVSAAKIALLMQERGLGGSSEDLAARLLRWDTERSGRAQASRKLAEGWAKRARSLAIGGIGESWSAAQALARARPDFVARRRHASGENWHTAGGRGFALDPASPLSRAQWLAIGDATGSAKGARITAAIALDEIQVIEALSDRIETNNVLRWRDGRIEALMERRLGAITLASGPDPDPDTGAIAAMLVKRALGNLEALFPPALLSRLRYAGLEDRVRDAAEIWLAPILHDRRDLDIAPARVGEAAINALDWDAQQRMQALAPARWNSPAGSTHAIDYASPAGPAVEVRVQALFGLDDHPHIGRGEGRVPLLLQLTSPAGRPIQATRDLPGFWRGSWGDVRKEMKGRYPKHRWPDEPWSEKPSLKTKNAFAKGGKPD
jgi:ATP-dependent helicase HrpB